MAEKHPPPLPPPLHVEMPPKGPHRKKGEFRVGDWVKHRDGATCKVEAVKEDGTLALVTDDGKHAFDAAADEVKEAERGAAS